MGEEMCSGEGPCYSKTYAWPKSHRVSNLNSGSLLGGDWRVHPVESLLPLKKTILILLSCSADVILCSFGVSPRVQRCSGY